MRYLHRSAIVLMPGLNTLIPALIIFSMGAMPKALGNSMTPTV